jgi:hypothetical protein
MGSRSRRSFRTGASTRWKSGKRPSGDGRKLLFCGDLSGNLLDGHQYILVAAGDTLYTFTLY